ncbi:hypothetical protein L6452_00006 [Arctium lappa]|uniref:Uncharacterized protein n=1 Tax=Arctium lappa TaxID=4217 RepID=A0ACB9FDH1_ARCLA|nr:hypothetical protein L6452_00006 [Arctium lappa]
MASRATDIDADDDGDDDDDLDFRFAPPSINRRPPVNANKVATTNAAASLPFHMLLTIIRSLDLLHLRLDRLAIYVCFLRATKLIAKNRKQMT